MKALTIQSPATQASCVAWENADSPPQGLLPDAGAKAAVPVFRMAVWRSPAAPCVVTSMDRTADRTGDTSSSVSSLEGKREADLHELVIDTG